jgi:hypothetical protein
MHSTFNLEDGYMGSGKRIRRSIQKHGLENHFREILEFLPDRSSLKEREAELVNEEILQDPMCMNICIGGYGGWSKDACSNGGKKRIEKQLQDKDHVEKMKKVRSDTWKRMHKEGKLKPPTFKNKQHSNEAKEKIGKINSIKQSGSGNSQYGTFWIFKDEEIKKIKKDDFELYLALGWKRGRKKLEAVN